MATGGGPCPKAFQSLPGTAFLFSTLDSSLLLSFRRAGLGHLSLPCRPCYPVLSVLDACASLPHLLALWSKPQVVSNLHHYPDTGSITE